MSTDNTQAAPLAAENPAPHVPGAGSEAQKTLATTVQKTGDGHFSDKATVGELLEFQVTGLLVVFVVLGTITLACNLIAQIIKMIAPDQYHCRPKAASPVKPAPASPAPAKPLPAPAAQTLHPGLANEKLIALLSVAAQEVLGHSVSIAKFRHLESQDWTWSIQGRAGLHSHSLPKH